MRTLAPLRLAPLFLGLLGALACSSDPAVSARPDATVSPAADATVGPNADASTDPRADASTLPADAGPPVTTSHKVLMFVAYNDVWWPEYKVMFEGLRAAGYTVDVRSSAAGFALADYSAPVDTTPSAKPLDASYPDPAAYRDFTGLFAANFGQAWSAAWDPIAQIPVDGRIQDVADLSEYAALVIPGGAGVNAYRFDGTYADLDSTRTPGHTALAADVEAAAVRLNALVQEALASGKPVAAQCHAAPLVAFARVPATTGGPGNLGRSVLSGRAATGYAFSDSDTLASYRELGITALRNEKVVIDGPEAPDFSGNGRDLILTSADWYPETAAYATRALVNLIETTPAPARRTRAIRALVFGGDEPTNYGEAPIRHTDLATLLNDSGDDLRITATPTADPAQMSAAALAAYDVLVYFRHNRITTAQQQAIVQWVDGGGGLVALHHATYDEGGAKGTLIDLIGATLPADVQLDSETGIVWNRESNNVINVNYGHFVSTWGVYSAGEQPAQSQEYVSPRGVPNQVIDGDAARGYWSFRIPANDELYVGMDFVPGVAFGRGINQIERLFSNDRSVPGSPNRNNGAYDSWGFVRRFDGDGNGVVGRIMYFEPGETVARTLPHPSFRQIVKNAVVWAAR